MMGMGATSGVTSISIIFGGVGENTGARFRQKYRLQVHLCASALPLQAILQTVCT